MACSGFGAGACPPPPAAVTTAAATSSSSGSSSSALSPQAHEQLEATRARSRSSQRRLREGELALQAEQSREAEAMAGEMAALRLENEQLAFAASLMEKTLEFRQDVLLLAQHLHVAPHIIPPLGSQPEAGAAGAAAVAAANQRLLSLAQRLPPQEEMLRFAAQLPGCGRPACEGACLTSVGAGGAQGGTDDGSAPAAAAGPAAGTVPTPASPASPAAARSSGDWAQQGAGAQPPPPRQSPQAPQPPARLLIPDDGWGIPGIPLGIGGGSRRSAAPLHPATSAPPAVGSPLRLPAHAASLQQPKQAVVGDGWGVPGVPLRIGGGAAAAATSPGSAVLVQVLSVAVSPALACSSAPAGSAPVGAPALALQAVGVPPPNDPAARRRVEGVTSLDDLQRLLGRLRRDVCEAWAAAQREGFAPGAASRAALDTSLGRLAQVFWHAAQLKPCLLNMYMTAALPPADSDCSALWRRVAAASLPLLSDSEVGHLRKAYQLYAKRMAVAAVDMRPFVQRLERVQAAGAAAAAAGTGAEGEGALPLNQVASQHMQVGELGSRLHRACEAQYLAAMGLLRDISRHASTLARCYWQVAAGAYWPDHHAILQALLQLHQQRAEAADPGAAGEPAAGAPALSAAN